LVNLKWHQQILRSFQRSHPFVLKKPFDSLPELDNELMTVFRFYGGAQAIYRGFLILSQKDDLHVYHSILLSDIQPFAVGFGTPKQFLVFPDSFGPEI
jgi:hypothetical protein